MAQINEHFLKLPGNYLFTELAQRVDAYAEAHPEARLIRLGIGDVTLPLAPAIVSAMGRAVKEMGQAQGFHGYGPEQGYLFLRQAIADGDYQSRGIGIEPEEIFVSDGAKSDCGGIGGLFGKDAVVAICDPVYPAYADANAIAGRAGEYNPDTQRWSGLIYLPCTPEGHFVPRPPAQKVDLIYLCFPNNPTGAVAGREALAGWVDYANRTGAVLLFDGAYEAFITTPGIPHSIYEIEGARTCAIEFRSFSKTAGFTGTRCAYTVIPKELKRGGASLHALWKRRQSVRFNGVSYVIQRGAQAVYTPEGRAQIQEQLRYYQNNAKTIRAGLSQAGLSVFGGVDSPYLWVQTPGGSSSWAFCQRLLEQAHVVTTPGVGFGPGGEGYIRLTGFGGAEDTAQAVERIRRIL